MLHFFINRIFFNIFLSFPSSLIGDLDNNNNGNNNNSNNGHSTPELFTSSYNDVLKDIASSANEYISYKQEHPLPPDEERTLLEVSMAVQEYKENLRKEGREDILEGLAKEYRER